MAFRGHVTSSGHVTIWFLWAISCWWSFGTKPLSLTISEIFNIDLSNAINARSTCPSLTRPLNKGQVIYFGTNRYLIYDFYSLSIVTFTLGRTDKPQYIPYRQTTDRQMQHCSISTSARPYGQLKIIVFFYFMTVFLTVGCDYKAFQISACLINYSLD